MKNLFKILKKVMRLLLLSSLLPIPVSMFLHTISVDQLIEIKDGSKDGIFSPNLPFSGSPEVVLKKHGSSNMVIKAPSIKKTDVPELSDGSATFYVIALAKSEIKYWNG